MPVVVGLGLLLLSLTVVGCSGCCEVVDGELIVVVIGDMSGCMDVKSCSVVAFCSFCCGN